MSDNTAAEPDASDQRRIPEDVQVTWVAGILTVLTAAVLVGILVRLTSATVWVPVASWFVAGVVAGAVVRKRQSAVKVAIVSTVCAAVITSAVDFTQAASAPRSLLGHAVDRSIGLWEMVMLTMACALACVVGAAGVVEYQRFQEQRRRR